MEYCDCGDLRLYLKKPIKEKWCNFFFNQLATGLKYLNKYNILHRDIKPRNILLTNNRKILKIADFGFAKQNEKKISLYNTICGSPLYMAPEIMEYNNYNNQTDLWSIGMILYEMLYGKHPFDSCKTFRDLLDMIENSTIEIPPKNTKNTNVSAECIDLLQRLLQKTVLNRLTWDEFFGHPWFNKITPFDDGNPDSLLKYKMKLCATSLGSLASTPSLMSDKHKSELHIIENYMDTYMGLQNSYNVNESIDDSYVIDSYSEEDKNEDGYIFKLEMEDDGEE